MSDGLHNCALESDGSIVCWGDNRRDQSTSPDFNDFNQISAGKYHNYVLKSDGSITCWGDNNYDQSTLITDGLGGCPRTHFFANEIF